MSDERQRIKIVALALAIIGCSGRALAPGQQLDADTDHATDTDADGSTDADASAEHVGIPRKDGVPIGDCTEPTADQLTAAGCPTTEPQFQAACDLPKDVSCRYAITTAEGRATQNVWSCTPNGSDPSESPAWFGGSTTCGYEGTLPPGDATLIFSTADCARRPVTSCGSGPASADSWATAQSLFDGELAQVIQSCAGFITDVLFEVRVEGGCPASLAISVDRGQYPTADAMGCLKASLQAVRWDCASTLVCGSYEITLL